MGGKHIKKDSERLRNQSKSSTLNNMGLNIENPATKLLLKNSVDLGEGVKATTVCTIN